MFAERLDGEKEVNERNREIDNLDLALGTRKKAALTESLKRLQFDRKKSHKLGVALTTRPG